MKIFVVNLAESDETVEAYCLTSTSRNDTNRRLSLPLDQLL